MDQIQREKMLEKLGKIKLLAERGVGGEKETAMRMYEELRRKYEISDNEIEASFVKLEKRWFSFRTSLEEKLLLQIFYKVTGDTGYYVYSGQYSRRKKRGCICTEVEAAEIQLLFNFYSEKMKEELEVFMIAFKQKNNLFPDETARKYKEYDDDKLEKELTEEERLKYKKAGLMSMSMEHYISPKAALETTERQENNSKEAEYESNDIYGRCRKR